MRCWANVQHQNIFSALWHGFYKSEHHSYERYCLLRCFDDGYYEHWESLNTSLTFTVQLSWDGAWKSHSIDLYHFYPHQTIQWAAVPYVWVRRHPGKDCSLRIRNISSQRKGDQSLCIDLQWPFHLMGQVYPEHKPAKINASHSTHTQKSHGFSFNLSSICTFMCTHLRRSAT